LSGVLEEQAEQLQTQYAEFCQMDAIAVQDEWVRLSGVRY
jgi:ribosomal protein L11 methyltransferase